MKKALLIFGMMVASQAAVADHSLRQAMDSRISIRKKVEALIDKSGLMCALDTSLQMPPSKKLASEHSGDVWRQVAICFENAEQAAEFSQPRSNTHGGIYGFSASAILDVTYDISTGKVIKASLK